jgi:hypothetical protein
MSDKTDTSKFAAEFIVPHVLGLPSAQEKRTVMLMTAPIRAPRT